LRRDFHRLPISLRHFVAVLPHGLLRGRNQQRMTGDEFHRAYRAGAINRHVESNRPLKPRLACQRGIDRIRLADQVCRLHGAAHANAAWHGCSAPLS